MLIYWQKSQEIIALMDYIALSRISLKHLTVLHMLLTTHSVTQAAERLCVTPSSVSKTLSQLRETLKDDLFYRDGTRLVPTPFALNIGPSIHGILSSMNGLLHQGSFNPAYYQGTFSLSMRGSSFELFAPVLTRISQQLGNNAHLSVHAKEEMSFDSLVRGQVDFLLLPHDISQPPTQNKDLVWQTILKDEMVCLMGESNPLAKAPCRLKVIFALATSGFTIKIFLSLTSSKTLLSSIQNVIWRCVWQISVRQPSCAIIPIIYLRVQNFGRESRIKRKV